MCAKYEVRPSAVYIPSDRSESNYREMLPKFLVHFSVTSLLDYCNPMLFGIPKYQHDRLQRILNAAARNVCLVHTFSHHTPVLYNLYWLPVPYRIQFKILLLVHPALSGVAPVYVKEASKRSGSYNLRSKLSCEFKVPKTK